MLMVCVLERLLVLDKFYIQVMYFLEIKTVDAELLLCRFLQRLHGWQTIAS